MTMQRVDALQLNLYVAAKITNCLGSIQTARFYIHNCTVCVCTMMLLRLGRTRSGLEGRVGRRLGGGGGGLEGERQGGDGLGVRVGGGLTYRLQWMAKSYVHNETAAGMIKVSFSAYPSWRPNWITVHEWACILHNGLQRFRIGLVSIHTLITVGNVQEKVLFVVFLQTQHK